MIKLDAETAMKMMGLTIATPNEFTIIAIADKDGEDYLVHTPVVADISISAFETEVDPKFILELPLSFRKRMNVWIHRHGISGWSETDEDHILNSPLGCPPTAMNELISVAITPNGLIGRVDRYNPHSTQEMPVWPQFNPEFLKLLEQMIYHDRVEPMFETFTYYFFGGSDEEYPLDWDF